MINVKEVFTKWQEIITETAKVLYVRKEVAEYLANDRALERFVFLSVSGEVPSLEMLLILAAQPMMLWYNCDLDIVDYISFWKVIRKKFIEELVSIDPHKFSSVLDSKEANYNSITDLVRIANILESRKNMSEAYFRTYESKSDSKYFIRVYDGRSDGIDINIRVDDDSLVNELGFYRKGYNYRFIDGSSDDLINSVTRTLGMNEERGHYDLTGYGDNPELGWVGIYTR